MSLGSRVSLFLHVWLSILSIVDAPADLLVWLAGSSCRKTGSSSSASSRINRLLGWLSLQCIKQADYSCRLNQLDSERWIYGLNSQLIRSHPFVEEGMADWISSGQIWRTCFSPGFVMRRSWKGSDHFSLRVWVWARRAWSQDKSQISQSIIRPIGSAEPLELFWRALVSEGAACYVDRVWLIE